MATRGFENFTATDVAQHGLKHARRPIAGAGTAKAGRSKYGAVKTTVDGIVFDSKAEAGRYSYLKALERTGHISALGLQPEYPIVVNRLDGERALIAHYRADFEYVHVATGRHVVEDVKGMKTPVYRLKKKLVEALYGFKITEIR